MIKGFALNDERLKNNGESPYFEELLARIRDIRSSEKIFWRKVLDIYATSIDYDPKDKLSIKFFKTVQNKISSKLLHVIFFHYLLKYLSLSSLRMYLIHLSNLA